MEDGRIARKDEADEAPPHGKSIQLEQGRGENESQQDDTKSVTAPVWRAQSRSGIGLASKLKLQT